MVSKSIRFFQIPVSPGDRDYSKSNCIRPMFAEKLVYIGKTYRTPVYHKDLLLILNTIGHLEGNEKGQNQNNLTLSFEEARRSHD